jgi:hypothetical protein
MTTPNPSPPDTHSLLHVDEYGIHQGVHFWRGYFTDDATSVFLSLQGRTAFGWSAWVNGDFVGSWLGNTTQFSEIGNLTLSSSNANVNADKNVLLITQDNSGHGETTGAPNPAASSMQHWLVMRASHYGKSLAPQAATAIPSAPSAVPYPKAVS